MITEVKTLDEDGTVTTWSGSTAYEPKGINNYVTEFTYNDGSDHVVSTGSYAAFRAIVAGATLAIQPTSLTSQAFPTAAEYLTAGTGGLSTSTAINVTTSTAPITLNFQIDGVTFIDQDDNILFLGDAADNQSNDSIILKDSLDAELGRVDLVPADWSTLGDHTIDRWNLITGSAVQEDTARGLSFTALTWADFGVSDVAQLLDLASIEFQVPKSTPGGELPRTDYAFFAANTNYIDSPDLLPPRANVPTISSFLLVMSGLPLLLVATNRRKSKAPK